MPVSTTNNEYLKFAPDWKLCRDVCNGSKAIKAGKTQYLPKPSGMSEEDYNGYLLRANFKPFTGRSTECLVGLMGIKPLIKEVPDGLMDYLDNVDGQGTNLDTFVENIAKDCVITNWGGILVDAPIGQGESIAQAEEMGLYPYISFYKAESIINTKYTTINRNKVLSMVVLQENVSKPTEDKFADDTVVQYRVLELSKDGIYQQTVYDDKENVVSAVIPKKMGKPLNHIPFYFLPENHPSISMVQNLADVNLSHYRKSADLENGAHWTGVPTPYCRGYVPDKKYDEDGKVIPSEPVVLGGSQFLFFPKGADEINYLEFSGQGCNLLRQMMLDDEDTMALLGARIIATEKKGVESAETAKIHRSGENSVLATFANKISHGITLAIREYLEWTVARKITEAVNIQVNTDYNLEGMDSSTLTALMGTWQKGGISKRTLFENLQKGEIISTNKTFEDEQQEIEEEGVAPIMDIM